MSLFKKLLLGTALASALLFALPAEQAQAGTILPSKQFWYDNIGLDASGNNNMWVYRDPLSTHGDGYLHSTNSLSTGNLAVSYLQFIADNSSSILSQLSLFIKDVAPVPINGKGTLSIYRVDDNEVNLAGSGIEVLPTTQLAPIEFSSSNLLAVENITNSSLDDKWLTLNFSNPVTATVIGGNPYVSFAIVAAADANTESIVALQYALTSENTTPAPEPMSAAYMLIGAGALAFRRARKVLGIA